MVPGDRLFVYTDGIIDAPNLVGESFGLKRLKDVLDANAAAPLSELKSTVLKTLTQYTQKELNHDDVTLIVLEIC
jgi:sigma-B regulation protein RsbU (phosphoserine phosphatase)